jgi:hypothetical protein
VALRAVRSCSQQSGVVVRSGAEWARSGLPRKRGKPDRFDVIYERGLFRVWDHKTGQFIAASYRFGDAAEMAYEFERRGE